MAPERSFRDPGGSCFVFKDRVLRTVTSDHLPDFASFIQSSTAAALCEEGRLVSTEPATVADIDPLLSGSSEAQLLEDLRRAAERGAAFEHQRVWFSSYPYEWTPSMLHAAAELTIEIAQKAFAEGFGIKDATPYNILFQGTSPLFVDVSSFEKRNPGDAIWTPFAQFARTFLFPLIANAFWGVPLSDVFLTRRDGLAPEEVYALASFSQRLRPPLLTLVSVPVWLSGRANRTALYQPKTGMAPEKARFVMDALFARLRRTLKRLQPKSGPASKWSGYMAAHSYNPASFAIKEEFVRKALAAEGVGNVLDVGANTGHFSLLSAEAGKRVVAIDSDPRCVDAIWVAAKERALNVLPLVVDAARPSPAVGWRNGECPAFLSRAGQKFDLVLMLALVHHLLVSERIPLDEVVELAAELTVARAVIEFVPPEDEMFRVIARGRDALFSGLTREAFEKALQRRFEIVQSRALPDSKRHLYHLVKKAG